ncbi:MAG TPA: GGDEF domain-containing protein [Kofleriaceae bacterium]|nr:GGDEF domain-containing protein [Kofleriaceae bacterium]
MSDEWDEDTNATDVEEIQRKVSEASAPRPCLTVLTGGAAGQMFKVGTGLLLGRIQGAEVRLDDDGISRKHAQVRVEGAKASIEDLGSRNGTFVNGTRITGKIQLSDGDKIQVGRATVLRFGLHDALDESFHESLVSSALRDGLTRLYNKRYLMERLDSELKFAQRHETALSLLLVDLDHFKKVNDTHGHLAGDAVLAQLASVIARAVRNEDVVARFGGEELAVVLRATGLDPALHTGERLRKLIEQTKVSFQGLELGATCSIGVAGFPSCPAHSPEELVDAADRALYRAKHAGRNRVMR